MYITCNINSINMLMSQIKLLYEKKKLKLFKLFSMMYNIRITKYDLLIRYHLYILKH